MSIYGETINTDFITYSKSRQKWRFVNDDDNHNYLIPEHLLQRFRQLLDDNDNYQQFNSTFNEFRIDSPYFYNFENPQEKK
jgi:hypothetical protein